MEFYYDTLIPYMPTSITDDQGNIVENETLLAGRKAMMELSEFQLSGNLMSLYQSVVFACKYANVDVIDTIASVSDDATVTVPNDLTVGTLLDTAAMMLFKSVAPEKYTFDIKKFVTYVLTATHYIFINIKPAPAVEERSDETGKEPINE